MIKTISNNDVIDGTSPLYVENENERSCLIQQDMVYDDNQTRQQCD